MIKLTQEREITLYVLGAFGRGEVNRLSTDTRFLQWSRWHERLSGGDGRNSRRPIFDIQMPDHKHHGGKHYRQ
jgi:hypothetical protein